MSRESDKMLLDTMIQEDHIDILTQDNSIIDFISNEGCEVSVFSRDIDFEEVK